MDTGINSASGQRVPTPLPVNWLGRPDAPSKMPDWASIFQLTTAETQNLLAQIGYDKSQWNYSKIGAGNALGRYQITPTTLENYGLLARGSNAAYGQDCVNYLNAWRPVTIRKNNNSYANYIYNVTSLSQFLGSQVSQDQLGYQILLDLYTGLKQINAVLTTDTADMVAGMIYVAWDLGVGTSPTTADPAGTGAYAWRFYNQGTGAAAYNSGRYAVTILSQ